MFWFGCVSSSSGLTEPLFLPINVGSCSRATTWALSAGTGPLHGGLWVGHLFQWQCPCSREHCINVGFALAKLRAMRTCCLCLFSLNTSCLYRNHGLWYQPLNLSGLWVYRKHTPRLTWHSHRSATERVTHLVFTVLEGPKTIVCLMSGVWASVLTTTSPQTYTHGKAKAPGLLAVESSFGPDKLRPPVSATVAIQNVKIQNFFRSHFSDPLTLTPGFTCVSSFQLPLII